ncbi:MAG: hypothetical protein ACRED2_08985, partial [Methylocella sp.]
MPNRCLRCILFDQTAPFVAVHASAGASRRKAVAFYLDAIFDCASEPRIPDPAILANPNKRAV